MPQSASELFSSLRSRIYKQSHAKLFPLRLALLAIAVVIWWYAARDWSFLFHEAYGNPSLGYDLNFSWQAAVQFSHGGKPFSISGFVYPPSHVLIAWPLAAASFNSVKHVGLYFTVLLMCATAALSAQTVGRRIWGPTAALAVLLLRFAQPVGDEIVLENVSALMAFCLALTLLLASRNRWTGSAVVLGIALSIKPMLIPVVIVYLLARKWRACIVLAAIPIVLNAVAFLSIHGIGEFWSVLPFLFNRTGAAYDAYNAALVSVCAITGLKGAMVVVLRVLAGGLTLVATWLAWTRLDDEAVRIVTSTGALLVGFYLFGSLTEDHYMLTLIPLLVSVAGRGSPMQWPIAWIGGAWIMAYHSLSPTLLDVGGLEAQAISRCLGLALLLITICVGSLSSRPVLRLYTELVHAVKRLSSSKTSRPPELAQSK